MIIFKQLPNINSRNRRLWLPPVAALLTASLSGPALAQMPEPSVSVAPVVVTEGDVAEVPLTLSAASTVPVTVTAFTRAGSAMPGPGKDYFGKTSVATFAPGETEAIVEVTTLQDTTPEPGENFLIILASPTNATIDAGTAGVTIEDDDKTTVSVLPVVVTEGEVAVVPVALNEASSAPITVTAFTRAGSATPGQDYYGKTMVLAFEPGETEVGIEVTTLQDDVAEPGENFSIVIANAINATIDAGTAGVTIDDDDGMDDVTVSVSPVVVAEGDVAMVPVTLSAASTAPVTVTAFTREGSAMAGPGEDFYGQTTEVTFAPGETETNVEVITLQDDAVEPGENFFVILANATNATIDTGTAGVTIDDDDGTGTVTVSIGSAEVTEGTDTEAEVEVTLSAATTVDVEVEVASREFTARSLSDYRGRPFTVTIAAGETTQTVAWELIDDTEMEETEEFRTVVLSADNAEIGEGGTVTILDDD